MPEITKEITKEKINKQSICSLLNELIDDNLQKEINKRCPPQQPSREEIIDHEWEILLKLEKYVNKKKT